VRCQVPLGEWTVRGRKSRVHIDGLQALLDRFVETMRNEKKLGQIGIEDKGQSIQTLSLSIARRWPRCLRPNRARCQEYQWCACAYPGLSSIARRNSCQLPQNSSCSHPGRTQANCALRRGCRPVPRPSGQWPLIWGTASLVGITANCQSPNREFVGFDRWAVSTRV
jgi:hypothetical protein